MAGALYDVIYDASHTNSIGGNGMVSILSISICISGLLNNFPSIGYDYRPFFDSDLPKCVNIIVKIIIRNIHKNV